MKKTEALQLLETLLLHIHDEHEKISESWKNTVPVDLIINQKTCKIAHYLSNPAISNSIVSYVAHLKSCDFEDFYRLNAEGFKVTYRIKHRNSIEEKIEDYIDYRPEKGEVSLSKCFNDLFGVRVVLDIPEIS